MSDPDHYAVLGVEPTADPETIREAWRFQLRAFHPDRFSSEQHARAELMAKRVNEAWQVLGEPAARARYDRQRRDAAISGAVGASEILRELPCVSCGTLSAVPDQAGRTVTVKCPACQQQFTAIVGATLLGRPRLEARYLGGRHLLHLVAGDGTVTTVAARKLPTELALIEGETVSVVLRGRGRGARYVIVHGRITDMGWRTG